jgi:dihydrofolate synthase/folylpolyglutamate synthase
MQLQNAAGVLALLEATGFDALLNTSTVNAALSGIVVPGRMQAVGDKWILDVAHNPAAATVLATTLAARHGRGNTVVILGMLDDKDVAGVVAPLNDIAHTWIAVTARSPRAIPAEQLATRISSVTGKACSIAASIEAALELAEELAAADDRVLVTGSFYVVGAALDAFARRS